MSHEAKNGGRSASIPMSKEIVRRLENQDDVVIVSSCYSAVATSGRVIIEDEIPVELKTTEDGRHYIFYVYPGSQLLDVKDLMNGIESAYHRVKAVYLNCVSGGGICFDILRNSSNMNHNNEMVNHYLSHENSIDNYVNSPLVKDREYRQKLNSGQIKMDSKVLDLVDKIVAYFFANDSGLFDPCQIEVVDNFQYSELQNGSMVHYNNMVGITFSKFRDRVCLQLINTIHFLKFAQGHVVVCRVEPSSGLLQIVLRKDKKVTNAGNTGNISVANFAVPYVAPQQQQQFRQPQQPVYPTYAYQAHVLHNQQEPYYHPHQPIQHPEEGGRLTPEEAALLDDLDRMSTVSGKSTASSSYTVSVKKSQSKESGGSVVFQSARYGGQKGSSHKRNGSSAFKHKPY